MPSPLSRLPRSFFERDTVTVARDLLGRYLVHRVDGVERIGMIVETEAYLGPHDKAAHSRHGVTKRNAAMFGPIGRAYVYFIYGMHECMNIVTETEGKGSAVLIRALEPISNIEARTNGPALLTRAMKISRAHIGCDVVLGEELYVTRGQGNEGKSIVATRRIGVDYAGAWAARKLRFYLKDNFFVSKRLKARPRS